MMLMSLIERVRSSLGGADSSSLPRISENDLRNQMKDKTLVGKSRSYH